MNAVLSVARFPSRSLRGRRRARRSRHPSYLDPEPIGSTGVDTDSSAGGRRLRHSLRYGPAPRAVTVEAPE